MMQLAIYGRSVQQLARDCASRPRWILLRSSVLQPRPRKSERKECPLHPGILLLAYKPIRMNHEKPSPLPL